jgi:glycosyltransferase 2 family protein
MRRWVAPAGVLLSLLMVGLMLWRVDLKRVAEQLSHFGWRAWLAGVAIYLLAFIPRGWRWKLMLPSSVHMPWAEVTRVVVIGYAANNILPLRLGEVVRSVVAGTRFKVSKMTCLGTIAAEKVLDGCCLLGLLAAALPFISIRADYRGIFRQLAIGVSVLFGMSLLGCFGLAKGDRWLVPWGSRHLPPYLARLLQSALVAVSTFKDRRTVLITALLTLVVWVLEGLCFSFFLSRMGVAGALPKGFFCLTIVNMSILVPSAPGYVGVFQAGAVAALLALGMDASQGLALGIVTHAAQLLPTTILGAVFVAAMGFSWRGFYRLTDE